MELGCGTGYFTPEEQSATAALAMSGYTGTPYIATASGELTVDCIGFVSWDDTTVIASIKDSAGINQIDLLLDLGGVAIPKGHMVGFGFVAKKITVTGSGIYIRNAPFAL